ncbi:hypothetical protein [uncultured Tenacibaculum sp.]|uniref:hypothetical protein n=1 Tax=uncultured Tenacibaculum sp. TaxID=174713 RepID=UPI0026198DFF|nr:hypothetical protein [uncultured Tenacibaculum sp.]
MKYFIQGLLKGLKPILSILLVVNYYYLLEWLEIDFYSIFPIGLVGGYFFGISIREIKDDFF